MRTFSIIAFSALLTSLAIGQSGSSQIAPRPPTAAQGQATAQPVRRGELSVERRLAAMEEQAESLLQQIKSLKAQIKVNTMNDLRIFNLKYMPASRAGALVNEVFRQDGLRVCVDERTNSLIFFATNERMEAVQVLLLHLDVEQPKKRNENP